MNRLIVPLALVAMAGLIYAVVGGDAFRGGPAQAPTPADAAPPPPAPPPPPPIVAMDAGVPFDMAVPEDTASVETLRQFGVFGRDAQYLDALLHGQFDRAEDKGGPTYRSSEGTQVTFRVEGGLVTGARADFGERAMSANLTGLSWIFSGQRDHIPLHWEGSTAGERYDGSYRDRFGRTVYYRGALQISGDEGLYGPAWIELSARPFKSP
ncbi:MAG: hypothetical protein KC613_05835 [Myxococcales bacterium]|nr:hypothetical protein [Myxococcales bacterium]MCB9523261.1 hypothetical protein [Myxococcales bacterium]